MVMRSVCVAPALWLTNAQTAGCPPAASVNVPTASLPRSPEAVASFIHAQLFVARPIVGIAIKQIASAAGSILLKVHLKLYRLLAILRTSRFVQKIGVDMPWDAFRGYLGMYTQEVQPVSGCTWIDLLIHKHRLLFRGFLGFAHAAVKDGQVIVRSKIVGVD